MKVFDAHVHILNHKQISYPWTADIPSLSADHLFEDYLAATQPHELTGVLFMETAASDGDYIAEAEYVANLMQQYPVIKGQIASIRPEIDDNFDTWLEQSERLNICGYRRILHAEENTLMSDSTFIKNVRKIGEAGKTFDLCVHDWQLDEALQFVKQCDNTTFVIDHFAIHRQLGENEVQKWRESIKALAACPNVNFKISGILLHYNEEKDLPTVKSLFSYMLEVCGIDKLIWSGDWPVIELGNTLRNWLDVTEDMIKDLSPEDQHKLLIGNTKRIYLRQ